ncbi:16S rRNA (uracil(1498)-N(3))-methyltransferase [Desulfolutivibrio sp.]|uniref:16S rRNA (uracil(1498)-N(3))-methyltransferase n=1 Tax=Desulfolutivibrio sp. TaxID=2773296 RepID=UPI002F96D8E5
MAPLDSFFLEPEGWREPYLLTGGEAAHLVRVLRKKPGETVRLFDGLGREGEFRIADAKKDKVTLEVLGVGREPEPEIQVWLAVGFAKSARRGALLEKAVELGAAGIVFWQAARSQGVMPEAVKKTWRDQMIAAAKQCGAARLPGIRCISGGAAGVAALGSDFDRRFVLWEEADPDARPAARDMTDPGRVLAVIGPEGGLAGDEVRTFQDAGFEPVSLGRRILRVETAAMAVLSLSLLRPLGR